MYRPKIKNSKFYDKESDTLIYADYLPIDIIRNEVVKVEKDKVKFEFILWNMLSDEQERLFLKGLENHKKDIIKITTIKKKEHYSIEAKP